MRKERKHEVIPYGADVQFYANESEGTAVPTWIGRPDYNKGWTNVRVGGYTAKARTGDEFATLSELLREHYPGHMKRADFYHDLSYHSPLNQGDAGKVKTYGMDPYMVDFSLYTPVKSYKLLYPVKTSAPGTFGKERNKVATYEWEYIVNNWIPMGKGNPIKWQVKHVIHRADGSESIVYQSPQLDSPDEALEKFNSIVVGVGGKPYKVSNTRPVMEKFDRLERAREGKTRIYRRTGRKRRQSATEVELRGLRG